MVLRVFATCKSDQLRGLSLNGDGPFDPSGGVVSETGELLTELCAGVCETLDELRADRRAARADIVQRCTTVPVHRRHVPERQITLINLTSPHFISSRRLLLASLRPRLLVTHRWLCSASRHHFIVSRDRRTSFTGRRAFSVAGPMAWNSLADYLRDTSLSDDIFINKQEAFEKCWAHSPLRAASRPFTRCR